MRMRKGRGMRIAKTQIRLVGGDEIWGVSVTCGFLGPLCYPFRPRRHHLKHTVTMDIPGIKFEYSNAKNK